MLGVDSPSSYHALCPSRYIHRAQGHGRVTMINALNINSTVGIFFEDWVEISEGMTLEYEVSLYEDADLDKVRKLSPCFFARHNLSGYEGALADRFFFFRDVRALRLVCRKCLPREKTLDRRCGENVFLPFSTESFMKCMPQQNPQVMDRRCRAMFFCRYWQYVIQSISVVHLFFKCLPQEKWQVVDRRCGATRFFRLRRCYSRHRWQVGRRAISLFS